MSRNPSERGRGRVRGRGDRFLPSRPRWVGGGRGDDRGRGGGGFGGGRREVDVDAPLSNAKVDSCAKGEFAKG